MADQNRRVSDMEARQKYAPIQLSYMTLDYKHITSTITVITGFEY